MHPYPLIDARRCGRACAILFLLMLAVVFPAIGFAAEQPADAMGGADAATNSAAATSPEARKAALNLELTNAWNRVLAIVNQPVQAYRRTPEMDVSISSPGWFHEGAQRPNFASVDVRKTQDLSLARHQYVTSDLNPGLVFLGRDLEFNSMTKYFYTNRTVPKHKLTEAQMVEINGLYRTIGHYLAELNLLDNPVGREEQDPGTDTVTEAVIPGQPLSGLRAIPKETRMLYGGIAIGALLLIVICLRVFGKR